jgi:hypothetical protein
MEFSRLFTYKRLFCFVDVMFSKHIIPANIHLFSKMNGLSICMHDDFHMDLLLAY